MKTRFLFVGRTRYRLPLDESRRRKFAALANVADIRVLASAPAGAPRGDDVFTLVRPFPVRALDGVAFHALLPWRVAREIRSFRPTVVLVQGAHEAALVLIGRKLARSRVPVVLDVHGDWRTATRLYGSPARRLLNPLADRLAAWAIRRVDAIRTVSDFTTALVREVGVEPTATFPAFMDLEPFLAPPVPLPLRPRALFVGVLELYKGLDLLAQAWPLVAEHAPDAELRLIGSGSRADLVRRMVEGGPNVTWDSDLEPEEVVAELDRATCLVLPSRREGMGRVVVEAFCRGRGVVGTRGGGIEDLVRDGQNGLLVPSDDVAELVAALVRILTDGELAERLAFQARKGSEEWYASPEEFASRMQSLVDADARG
jgi:glycosyltransferase involved in cell wall biosynthesis